MSIFFKRRTILEAGLFHGLTDWHCHILPGVDDGFRSMDDSISALEQYAAHGVREVWLTPHVMEDVPNTTAALQDRFEELNTVWQGRGALTLHLAAEYMLDSLFESRLWDRDLLPLGSSGNHLLVETSYFNPPANLVSMLKAIQSAGYFPVLAHPERYMYMDMEDYSALIGSGVRMQLNIPSLTGMYGPEVQKKAFALLRKGYYDIAGSDLHRTGQLLRIAEDRCLARKMFKAVSDYDFLTTI
ncbi:MAG TPA: capsular biosynthesis protein [Candidatus Coprenecus pullistercoris]|nr:capsular biosynthesis protein [Candidatus Coprenecus pullistercoris]